MNVAKHQCGTLKGGHLIVEIMQRQTIDVYYKKAINFNKLSSCPQREMIS